MKYEKIFNHYITDSYLVKCMVQHTIAMGFVILGVWTNTIDDAATNSYNRDTRCET